MWFEVLDFIISPQDSGFLHYGVRGIRKYLRLLKAENAKIEGFMHGVIFAAPARGAAKLRRIRIVNDPLYGLIKLPLGRLFTNLNSSTYQRLRRISQLGLTSYVYPGATHSRFSHGLGAFYLLSETLNLLKQKGVEISDTEAEAVGLAILMHDIGHSPFSHALEGILVPGVTHEEVGIALLKQQESFLGGDEVLSLAIEIWEGKYPRPFLRQLIHSQLDIDRLDYLQRDSFYTGVVEGSIGGNRLIHMFDVVNDELVVEEKGIWSIENYLSARRFMYFQVYFHKAVLAAEYMLIQIFRRARQIKAGAGQGAEELAYFLSIDEEKPRLSEELLNRFLNLDDTDIWQALKMWTTHPDPMLRMLCRSLMDRKLFETRFSHVPYSPEEIEKKLKLLPAQYHELFDDLSYVLHAGEIKFTVYDRETDPIIIKRRNGRLEEFSSIKTEGLPNVPLNPIVKYLMVLPKGLEELQ